MKDLPATESKMGWPGLGSGRNWELLFNRYRVLLGLGFLLYFGKLRQDIIFLEILI